MTYKSPIGGYRPRKPYKSNNRARGKPFAKGADPRRRAECGQGIPNGDERYCPACGRSWPKNEEHPVTED